MKSSSRETNISIVFRVAIYASIITILLLGMISVFRSSNKVAGADSEDTSYSRIQDTKPSFNEREIFNAETQHIATNDNQVLSETNKMNLGALRQWEFKNWKGKVVTGGVHRVKTLEEQIFSNSAERMIAGLLRIEPGTPMIGDSKALFNKRFMENFTRSLTQPELIVKDDSEEIKALKMAVNDVKAELKQRMDGGEDICKLLADTRDELKALGLYRQELEKTVKEAIRDGELSDEDAQICIEAANKMLAERGAKPLTLPSLYMKILKLKNTKHN